METQTILEIVLAFLGLATAVASGFMMVIRWVTKTITNLEKTRELSSERCRQDNRDLVRRVEKLQDDYTQESREVAEKLLHIATTNSETMRMNVETNREVLRALAKVSVLLLLVFTLAGCGDVTLPAFSIPTKPATNAVPAPDTAKQLSDLAHLHALDAAKVESDGTTIAQLRDKATALQNLRDMDAAESAHLAAQAADENKALNVINAALRDKETGAAVFWTVIGGSLIALVGVGIVFGLGGTTLIGPMLSRVGKFGIAIGLGLDAFAIVGGFIYARVLPFVQDWGVPVAVVAAAVGAFLWLRAHRGHLKKAVALRQAATNTVDKVHAIAYSSATALEPAVHEALAQTRADWDDVVKRIGAGVK